MINDNVKKASVFEDLFSDKKNLLELYRVLHPEDTDVQIGDLNHKKAPGRSTSFPGALCIYRRHGIVILSQSRMTYMVPCQ